MRAILLALLSISGALAQAQNPWPMERQDRWGTARAVVGPLPATVTTPWLYKSFDTVGLVSNCPALTSDGLGYVGGWLENKVTQFSQVNGGVTGTFVENNWVQSSPAVGVEGEVYSATVQSGKLYRINPATLSSDWQFTTNNGKVSDYDSCSPTIGPDGNVMMGGTGGIAWKINRQTGDFIWRVQGLGSVIRTIVFTRDDSRVIVSNGSSITAIDYATGVTVWTKALGSTAGAPGVAPNGTIVVGTGNGNVYGLNPTTGNQIWTFVTGGAVSGGPAFSQDGSFAYIGSLDRKLYAAQVSNGARPWAATTSDELREGPVVDVFGRIYVATRTSAVYCLNSDGSLRWNAQLDSDVRGPISIGPKNELYVPNGKLRMIRQQAINLDVLGLLVGHGTLVSGTRDQLLVSDDDYVKLDAPSVELIGQPVMQSTFVTSSPYKKATKFSIVLETRASSASLKQTVELFNTISGTWELVDSRPAPFVDTTQRIDILPLATDYQDNNGGIRARLTYWLNGRPSSKHVQAYVDYAGFVDVVPEFKL